MDHKIPDIEQVRHGISLAALAHDAQITKLQAELRDAYQQEVEMASVVAERRQFSQELFTARLKLDMYRQKFATSEAELISARKLLAERDEQLNDLSRTLAEAQKKLSALSESMLGALQLMYWRRRRRLGRGKS
ncbi:hypothetical protein ACIPWF_17165 [Paenarthrobacter sp. NPDC089989]|uniref:hypothetical protein n=1 Tax=unclassified Paenarthrobacter TaxID=2634190 RepID=UPI00381A4025